MGQRSLLRRAVRGALAGVAGTAMMTAWQEAAAKLRSSGAQSESEGTADPWRQAPAPAQVGRLLLRALGYDVPADQVGLLTNVMHWGYGTTWGAVYGIVVDQAAQRPLARGLGFGTWVWVMSYVQLVPLGIYQPPWKYPAGELALDLSYHLAYGAGLGVSGAVLER